MFEGHILIHVVTFDYRSKFFPLFWGELTSSTVLCIRPRSDILIASLGGIFRLERPHSGEDTIDYGATESDRSEMDLTMLSISFGLLRCISMLIPYYYADKGTTNIKRNRLITISTHFNIEVGLKCTVYRELQYLGRYTPAEADKRSTYGRLQ